MSRFAAAPAWAAPYIGVPYVAGGRDIRGADCWGLFALVQRDVFGRDLAAYDGPDFSGRASAREVAAAAEAFAARFARVDPFDVRAGDAALFRVMTGPMHIGCIVAPGVMVHASEGADSCLARIDAAPWATRLLAFYRGE